MSAFSQAVHDELCKLDGPNAKDGVGRCPAMLFAKDESHMSEVFAIDTDDKTVSDQSSRGSRASSSGPAEIAEDGFTRSSQYTQRNNQPSRTL